jgi:hypothetical protein
MASSSLWNKFQILGVVKKLAQEKQILVYSQDDSVQDWLRSVKMDGSVSNVATNDYLALFESNLGANKANCCVQRSVSLATNFNEGELM